MVPVRDLGWKSRFEVRTGRQPDVRYMFGFGELSRVLKPLELRQHKFDCFTDDCIYLGTVRDGRGIRFLRLSNRKVYVRNDMVVTQGVMPYRSVGGLKTALQVKSIDAADLDIIFNVRWD